MSLDIEEQRTVETRIQPTRAPEHHVDTFGMNLILVLETCSNTVPRDLISNRSTLIIFPASMLACACATMNAIRKAGWNKTPI